MPQTSTLRFAVGSPADTFSDVWRLVSGNESYLGADAWMMGHFKITLHADHYVSGFTRQSGTKFESGSRIHRELPRPPEFRSGWVRGPVVAVPHTTRGPRALLGEKWNKPIVWVPPPGPSEVVLFSLAIQADGAADLDPIFETGEQVLGKVRTRAGESIHVVHTRQPLTPAYFLTYERFMAARENQWIYDEVLPERPPGTALVFSVRRNLPFVTDIPMPMRLRDELDPPPA